MSGWEACFVCGEWQTKRGMKKHLNSKHGSKTNTHVTEGKFTCVECHSTFRRPSNLKRHHKLVHNKILPIGSATMITEFKKSPEIQKSPKPVKPILKITDYSKVKFRIIYNHSDFYRERLATAACKSQHITNTGTGRINSTNTLASAGTFKGESYNSRSYSDSTRQTSPSHESWD